MKLSQYFQNNKLETDKSKIEEFKKNKNVRLTQLVNGDRTVCQMLRNINVLTKYVHEDTITIIIKYINNAVLKLREYKNNFDKDWWFNKSNIEFNRSIFDPYFLEISKKTILIDHELFLKFNFLYNLLDNNEKNLLLECVYYTNKINLKLCEYENMYIPLTDAGKNYTNQWNNIFNLVGKINIQEYEPYYITFVELQKRLITKPYYLKSGIQTPLNDYSMFTSAFDYSRKPLLDIIETKKYESIVELGSGFGRNIYYYASKLLDKNYNFYMGEYTQGGISAANLIKDKFFKNKKIKINHFDYNNSDTFFEQLKMEKKHNSILFSTFWSIEQITVLKKEVIENMLSLSNNISCIHIEPIGWQISEKSIMKEDKTDFRKYYNKNLYSILKELENENKIKIDEIKLDFFNFGDPESCGTLIKWTKI